MTGFEPYHQEIADLDHQIHHYAAICNIKLTCEEEIEAFLQNVHHADPGAESPHETLRALLVLRIKIETEMLEQGFTPPPLTPPS